MIALKSPARRTSTSLDAQSQNGTPPLTRWDDRILRGIAVYHLLKASFFVALGFCILHFVHRDIAQVINDYLIGPFNLSPNGKFLKGLLMWSSSVTPHAIRLVCYLFFFYGLIFTVEGIGLYLRKHWAEYMAVIVVCSLLPFEFYEISLNLAWWKLLILAGNGFIIAFLIRRIVLEQSYTGLQAEDAESDLTSSLPVRL